MCEIELTKGMKALVDDEDYERLSAHSWAFNSQGGYAVRKGSKTRGEPRTVQMHREVLQVSEGDQIDHINGNRLDNQKANLRVVDVQKNAFNRRKPNVFCTSQYKGVYKRKNRPSWNARIKYNDKHIELGTYRDETYAAAVYNFAASVFFGEYMRGNEGTDLPELDEDLKRQVFEKCRKAITKHGWYVDTNTYRSFYLREAA